MSSHILRFHESVDTAYARPSDAFADLRRIAREVPQAQRGAILDRLFDTGMRERRPFLSFNDRRVGVFIGTPWCIWEEWRILRDERSKCGEGETNVSTEWARSWDAPEKHTTFLQHWTNVQLQSMAANMVRRVREEIPLLTTARVPLLASFPTPQWYIVGQHVREWLPNEGQRIAVLPFSPNAGQPSQTQWTNSTLLKTHCPDFAAWLSLMVEPNDWTKDLIVSAAQGYFKESPPSESLLPELETVVP